MIWHAHIPASVFRILRINGSPVRLLLHDAKEGEDLMVCFVVDDCGGIEQIEEYLQDSKQCVPSLTQYKRKDEQAQQKTGQINKETSHGIKDTQIQSETETNAMVYQPGIKQAARVLRGRQDNIIYIIYRGISQPILTLPTPMSSKRLTPKLINESPQANVLNAANTA